MRLGLIGAEHKLRWEWQAKNGLVEIWSPVVEKMVVVGRDELILTVANFCASKELQLEGRSLWRDSNAEEAVHAYQGGYQDVMLDDGRVGHVIEANLDPNVVGGIVAYLQYDLPAEVVLQIGYMTDALVAEFLNWK